MGSSLDRMTALGASFLPGGVTFRVWAPRCRSVDAIVDGRAGEALAEREGGLLAAGGGVVRVRARGGRGGTQVQVPPRCHALPARPGGALPARGNPRPLGRRRSEPFRGDRRGVRRTCTRRARLLHY